MKRILTPLVLFFRSYGWLIVAILLFLAEVGTLTFYRKNYGLFWSPMIAFVIAVALGLIGCRMSITRSIPAKPFQPLKLSFGINVLLYIVGLLLIIPMVRPIIQQTPVDPSFSDIIPQLWNLVDRFRAGTFPYDPITDWGFTMYPTYLPLQWGPFLIPDILGFDYRWMSLGVLFFAIATMVIVCNRLSLPFFHQIALVVLSFLALYHLIKYEPIIYGVTIESLLAGYYLLLGLSLFSRSILIRAGGILLCLLSRYALVLWLPLYFLIVLFEKGRNKMFQLAGLLLLGVLLLYVLPFLLQDPAIFMRGYEHHTKAAIGEWSGQPWQQEGEFPAQLTSGIGLAAWFYDLVPGPVESRLQVLQLTHLISALLIALGAGWLFWRYRTQIEPKIFAVGSLKLYLAFFYHFIQIPYIYLYIVPLFFSLMIILITGLPRKVERPFT